MEGDSQLPDISVVVPAYAEHDRLHRLLASLGQQRYPKSRVEVVVVDDGSPEPVCADIAHIVPAVTVRLLRHSQNAGRAQARNTGIAGASGELIVFIDSDMTAAPDLLQAHAAAHRDTDRCVAVGDVRFGPDVRRTALARYLEGRGVHRLPPGSPVPFNCFSTGNASVRRALLLAAGCFDSRFRRYGGEDLELGYRLHCLGARFAYAEGAHTLHHRCRSLEATCDLMRVYGVHSLPLLVDTHPELRGVLRLGFLDQRRSWRAAAMRLALSNAVYWPVRLASRLLDSWRLPEAVLDYLLWASRTRGYLEKTRLV